MSDKKATFSKDQVKAYTNANDLAREYGSENLDSFISDTMTKINSKSPVDNEKGNRLATDFTNKLIMLTLYQSIENLTSYVGIYKWVNSFDDGRLNVGNSKQYSNPWMKKNTTYKVDQFIATKTSKYDGEVATINFLKNDGTLASGSYQYMKDETIISNDWFVYFMNGNLGKYLSIILDQAQKNYTIFKAYQVQQIIKKISDGTNQVPSTQAGENGHSLKLKTITSQANDMYEATVEFLQIIYDFQKDVNKFTLANDAKNLENIAKGEYLIFAPKKYIASFYSGVLSRLPSAHMFNIKDLIDYDNLIPSGIELMDTTDVNGEGYIDITNNPFLGDDMIVVLEKKAIRHLTTLSTSGNQYYIRNMANDHVIHKWGVFGLIPWRKGFVFKCANLLTPTP